MVASSVQIAGLPDGVSYPNTEARPAISVLWTGGTGPFDVEYTWDDDATFGNGNGNQQTALNTSVTSIDTAAPPADLADLSDGTTWYIRANVIDNSDSGELADDHQFTYFDPIGEFRHLYFLANVGPGFEPTDDPESGDNWDWDDTGPDGDTIDFFRHLYFLANVGPGFKTTDEPVAGWGEAIGGNPDGGDGDEMAFDRDLYLLANIDTTQPCPFITSISSPVVETGDTIVVRGQGLVSASSPTADAWDAEVRVYDSPSFAASFSTLTIVDWTAGDTEDTITVTVPGGTTSGFLAVVHTTTATCDGSNFAGLTVTEVQADRTAGWWVEVWDIQNTTRIIDHVKDVAEATIEPIANDMGSGEIVLPADHRDLPDIIDRTADPAVQRLVKVYLWGRFAYAFLPDDVDTAWDDDKKRRATIPGLGAESILTWGRALWADYPVQPTRNRIWQYGATDNVAAWGNFDPTSSHPNGTFEGADFDGWSKIGASSLFADTAEARSGSYSLRVTADTDEGTETDLDVSTDFDAFVDLYLTDPTNSGHAMLVAVVDEEDTVVTSATPTLSNVWSPTNLTFTPAEGKTYRLQVTITESGVTSHQFFIDDVAVYSDPEIPTLSTGGTEVDLSRTHVDDGLHSLKCVFDAGGDTSFIGWTARATINPSTKYRLRLRATGAAGDTLKVAMRIGGAVVSTTHDLTGPAGTFDTIELEGTSSSTDTTLRMAVSSQEAASITVWLDSLTILPGEPADNPGKITSDVHTAMAARGTLDFITLGFDATADSSGTPWPEDLAVDIPPDWSLWDIVQYWVGLGYDMRFAPENWVAGGDTGWQLDLWAPGNGGNNFTADPDGPAYLPGPGIANATPSGLGPASTVAFGEGKAGAWAEQVDATLAGTLERREDFIYNRELASTTTLSRALARRLTLSKTRGAQGTIAWKGSDVDPLPFFDFFPLDTVRAHLPADTTYAGIPDAAYRVAATPIHMTAEGISGEVDLGRYSLHRQSVTDQLVQRQVERARGVDNYGKGAGRVAGTVPDDIAIDESTGLVPAPHTHDEEEIFGLVLTGDVNGELDLTRVAGIRGRTVSTTAPSDNQVYAWDATAEEWKPTTPSGSGGGAEAVEALAADDHSGRGTTAFAREFDDAESEDSTTVEDTSPNITKSKNYGKLNVYHPGGDASEELHGIMWSYSPGGDFYIIAAATVIARPGTHSVFGVIAADGATYNSGGQMVWGANLNDSSLTLRSFNNYNSQVTSTGITNAHGIDGALIYLRLAYNSSTNVWSPAISPNGDLWSTFGVGTLTRSLTISHVGFFHSSWGGNIQHIASWEYIAAYSGTP